MSSQWKAGTNFIFVQEVAASALGHEMTRGWVWLSAGHWLNSRQLSRLLVVGEVSLQGWLFLQPLLPSQGMQAFREQVSHYTKTRFNITISADAVDFTYSVALHDAVMLYAHAATKVLSEGGDLRDGQAVTKAIRSTTFEGVGGMAVALNKQGDRIESYEVMNYVLEDDVIRSVGVGVFKSMLRQYQTNKRTVVWPGNTTKVPKDYVHARKIPSCGKTEGGKFYSEATQSCQPCAIGMYREPWGSPEHNDYSDDEVPRVCDSCSVMPGYSDQTELRECKACPTHSHRPVH